MAKNTSIIPEDHEEKAESLRRALREGAASGDAGALDIELIKAEARTRAGLAPTND